MKPLNVTVAQLANLKNYELGVSEWFHIGQERIDQFADATEDHQWIHVDSERAATGPFGRTIAHGYLTLALLPHLLTQLLKVTDEVRGTNYGLDRVRFTGPVRVGSYVRLIASIVESHVRPDG